MFIQFFYTLRERGIPVTPTSFLRLHKAMRMGLITSIEDFYSAARAVLIKNERYFDLYDQIFAHHFQGVSLKDPKEVELTEIAQAMLEEWLKDPKRVAQALDIDEKKLSKMTPEELLQYFMDRLKDQTEEHHGGNKWIGTGGTSPVGHSGYHPGGMRVSGVSRSKSAVKVAMERRYRDYSLHGPITESQMGEALKRLRNMIPDGPKDVVNVEKTIYETMRNAGEIEIIFDRRLTDRLKIILMIDNGGWSMDPYVDIVQTLFNYARSQFKELKIYYFHNTIYKCVWEDPHRHYKPENIADFARRDPDTRLIIVGDASMAPSELTHRNGAIYFSQKETTPSIEQLKFLASLFPHSAWLNPQSEDEWRYTWTVGVIEQIFPMFELTLNGLDQAVRHLMARH